MERTIAELESALAFWENVRWTAKGAELKAGAHGMVLSIRADLAKAKAAAKAEAELARCPVCRGSYLVHVNFPASGDPDGAYLQWCEE